MSNKLAVIALGGNAINRPDEEGTASQQFANIESTVNQLIKIIDEGYDVVLTHGNGPQVGKILIQQEKALDVVPAQPLDICGSQTQGQIGYMIQQKLINLLKNAGINKTAISLITEVIVDKEDRAFQKPTKPVGPFFSEEHAREMMEKKGENWVEDSGRGWRRVVPSPLPQSIVEIDSVKELVDQGKVVICCGGGGIPVIKDGQGLLQGVEAVIDKDRAAEKLAEELGADIFMILTDVSYAALNYGTSEEENITEVSSEMMKTYLKEGHFSEGSMKPKVESALKFVENGGRKAIISSINNGYKALTAGKGTIIT